MKCTLYSWTQNLLWGGENSRGNSLGRWFWSVPPCPSLELTPELLTLLPCAIWVLFFCPPHLNPVKLLTGDEPGASFGIPPDWRFTKNQGKCIVTLPGWVRSGTCRVLPCLCSEGSANRGRVLFLKFFFFFKMSFCFPKAAQIHWEGGTSRGHTTNISPSASPHSLPGYHPSIITPLCPGSPGLSLLLQGLAHTLTPQ